MWSTPAAPRLAFTFAKALLSAWGVVNLSHSVYQTPPFTPLSRARTIRSVQTVGSTQAQRGGRPVLSPTGLALAGTRVGDESEAPSSGATFGV
jgi:hypothetical protein